MRGLWKFLTRILVIFVLAAVVVVVWKRQELVRLWAVYTLFDEGRIVENFSNMDQVFPANKVSRGDGPVSDLPQGDALTPPSDFDRWIVDRSVTGIVVVKDGQQVHESYYQGTDGDDLRISWSVAKSFLSALMGILLDEGVIASIDDPVVAYVPHLKGSAYDGATIRNVLQMSSGVTFDEDYLDPLSDINKMGYVLALGGSMDRFAASLDETFAPAGQQWQYVSIDTHILGMVIRGATGSDLATLVSQKIVAPLGFETSPYYVTDGKGVAFALGGLNLRTRDYAKLGLMFLQMGDYGGANIVPASWVAESTRPSAKTKSGEMGYGYQWWSPKGATEGEFFALGVYGQFIYINRPAGVVIALNSADRLFKENGVREGNIAMFRQIVAMLVGER